MKKIIKPDEMQILKGQLVEVSPEVVLLATYQYHTEKKDDIDGVKTDRTKSRYRWIARVFKKEDYEAEVRRLMSDECRLGRFKWWDDPTWDGYVMSNDSDNLSIARFMGVKLKKLRPWEIGMKIFDGWSNATKTRPEGYNKNARYETEGYTTPTGEVVSLTDKDKLLALVGCTLAKDVVSKTAMSKTA